MKRYIFLIGGAGSGKSTFQAQKEVAKMFETNSRLLCIRKVHATLKESCFAELVGVIEEWKLTAYFDITRSPLYIRNKITGSDVLFRGMDNPEKIKSIRRVKRVWCEEATELNREDFNQLDLRLRGSENLQLTCTFNPVDEDSWLNSDFCSKGNTEDVEILHTTYLDNRWADEKYRTVMERLKEQDPKMYAIYAKGLWGKAVEGLIFNFTEIAEIPEEAVLLGYGMDFGFTNDPTTLIALYRWNGSIILHELLYKTHLTNPDIIKELQILGVSKSTPIFADSSEPKSIEDIYRAGYNIKGALKGPDSIRYGIDTLNQQPIIVTSSSGNIKKEAKKYCWAKDKDGKVLKEPIDAWNHCFIGETKVKMKEGYKRIDEIKEGDFVATPNGYQKVTRFFNNGIQNVKRYEFSNGSVIFATPKHQIYTQEGWKDIDALRYSDIVFVGKYNTSTEKNIGFTLEKDIFQDDVKEYTESCMNSHFELFRNDITYTTKIETVKTILLKTLNLFLVLNIFQNTRKSGVKIIKNLSKIICEKLDDGQKNGMQALNEYSGTGNTMKSTKNYCIRKLKETAIFVTKNIKRLTASQINFAQTSANLKIGENLESTMSKENANAELFSQQINTQNLNTAKLIGKSEVGNHNVYDIEVEEEHCFFAEDILVHNCLDASRYVSMMTIGKKKRELKTF